MDSILQSKSNKYIFSSVKAILLILYGVVNLAKGLPDLSNANIVVGTKAEDPFNLIPLLVSLNKLQTDNLYKILEQGNHPNVCFY